MFHTRLALSRAGSIAVTAALALALGAGGADITGATIDTGPRAVFVPITPCRIMDTRPAPDNVGPRSTPLGANQSHTVQTLGTNGNCTIPADAVGLTMNVAAVNPTASSFLTVHPSGVTRPLAANLNWAAGDPPVSNAVTVDIGDDGAITFYNLTGTVDLTADIVGYYAGHTHDDRYSPLGHTHDDRYSPLGHNHDDRYARAEQTLRIDGREMQLAGTGSYTLNSCVTSGVGSESAGSVPITLPVGSALRQVRVAMLDGASATGYSLNLLRVTLTTSGASAASLGTATGGTLTLHTVTHTLTPATPEILSEDETIFLQVSLGATTTNNALCQISVDYDLTP